MSGFPPTSIAGGGTLLFNLGTGIVGLLNLLQGNPGLTLELRELAGQNHTGAQVITYVDFEVPERFDSAGGKQETAAHEFPGGIKTLQALGPFPETLRWEGILIGGTQPPLARSVQMDQVRRRGNICQCTYGGQYVWTGIVTRYKAVVHHQNLLYYTVDMDPATDDTSAVQGSTPTRQGLFSQWLSKFTSYAATALGLSPATVASIKEFLTTLDKALLPAAGLLTAIDPTAVNSITAAAGGLSALLAAEGLSTNVTTASSAKALLSLLGTLTGLVTAVPGASTVINTVNPNLPKTASAYTGSAANFPSIGGLNGTLDTIIAGAKNLLIP